MNFSRIHRRLPLVLTAAATLTAGVVGCASSTDTAASNGASNGASTGGEARLASGPVNTVCPIGGHEVNPEIGTVMFQGKEVAFCCEGCLEAWPEMSDDDRSEALASVMQTY